MVTEPLIPVFIVAVFLASIPGMFERSITIGSIGKTFSVTGWKCGWALTGHPAQSPLQLRIHRSNYYTGGDRPGL